ncbi:disulfide-isomerase A6 [Aphelenchoides avenae]|nr:disulfide-isomerase A6 [Aphelenchus avenae]KAH7727933.1 disulfide-isomerase A6 [Aphelenchus avenae]
MTELRIALLVCFVASGYALYDKSSPVVELTANNFNNKVINDDSVWIVEFYAPWCGHCKNLVPEYTKAAKALKGLVKVGAVDMTEHQSVGGPYNVQGFPTIKIFGGDKKKPTDYNGARSAQALIDAALAEVQKTAKSRLSGGSGGSSGSGSRGGKGGNDVVELTDSNFEELVLKSKDLWLVEFFAPWCGHCKNLEPHWKAAASELKGKVKLGALDATVHTVIANRFGIRGFPTIKFFGAGEKAAEDAVDYDGGRTTNDIVQWALNKASENLPPPELKQITSDEVVQEACAEKQLCIVTFLPQLLDCQSECRNKYLNLIKDLIAKYKKSPWGWVWTEAAGQPDLEKAFDIGGFGYPAMVAVNSRKMKFSTMTGSFAKDGINEFLRDLSYGKGKTSSIKGNFPKAQKVDAWDGKDGKLPEVEEIDLSDVDLDEDVKTEL